MGSLSEGPQGQARLLRFFTVPGVVKIAPGVAVTIGKGQEHHITLLGKEGEPPEVIDSSIPLGGRA
ncbi:hypothetical protein ACFL06_00545 [Patescibacteria group bacterium]